MLRLLGVALVAAGCVAAGCSAAASLSARTRDLGEAEQILEAVARELEWSLVPLPVALQRAAAGSARAQKWLGPLAERIASAEEQSFQNLWDEALRTSGLALTGEDCAVLQRLGTVLGRYDAASQCQALAAAGARLHSLREEAAARQKALSHLYRTLGLTVGALLMVLLL